MTARLQLALHSRRTRPPFHVRVNTSNRLTQGLAYDLDTSLVHRDKSREAGRTWPSSQCSQSSSSDRGTHCESTTARLPRCFRPDCPGESGGEVERETSSSATDRRPSVARGHRRLERKRREVPARPLGLVQHPGPGVRSFRPACGGPPSLRGRWFGTIPDVHSGLHSGVPDEGVRPKTSLDPSGSSQTCLKKMCRRKCSCATGPVGSSLPSLRGRTGSAASDTRCRQRLSRDRSLPFG